MAWTFSHPVALLLLLLLPALVYLGWPRLRYLQPARRWTAMTRIHAAHACTR